MVARRAAVVAIASSMLSLLAGKPLSHTTYAQSYCPGTQSNISKQWPGPAESTTNPCQVLIYHSTGVGYYQEPAGPTHRVHQWLQAGQTSVNRVSWTSRLLTSCMRNNGTWRWEYKEIAKEEGRRSNTPFIQEYGPDYLSRDLTMPGSWKALECAADPHDQQETHRFFFVGASIDWTIRARSENCQKCNTRQLLSHP